MAFLVLVANQKWEVNDFGPHLDMGGCLIKSMQYLLKVSLKEPTRLISFAGVESIETKPCLESD